MEYLKKYGIKIYLKELIKITIKSIKEIIKNN